MLKKFLKTTYFMFHQLKIVHSIPGRLRLFVPGLSGIPEEMRKHEHYTTDLILSKEGIQSVQYSYLTNKVLIHYEDRKSTRLNSSHANISYAVFCLKKKKNTHMFYYM